MNEANPESSVPDRLPTEAVQIPAPVVAPGAEFGWGMVLGAAGGLLVALLATVRAASEHTSFGACWLALCGAVVWVMAPAAGALRLLRWRLSSLTPLLIGVVLAAAPLMVFARVLKSATHHRPLGAVTFALLGGGLLLGAIVIASRLVSLSRGADRGGWVWRIATVALTVVLLLLALRLGAPALAEPAIRAALFDTAVALVLLLAAARLNLPRLALRSARVLGPALWLALSLAGLVTLRAVPNVAASLQSAGLLWMAFAPWLAG